MHLPLHPIALSNPFHTTNTVAMAIETLPLPVPPTADAQKLKEFGREVKGVNPGELTPEQFKEVHDLLYKVSAPVLERHLTSLKHNRVARRPAFSRCGSHAFPAICPHQGLMISV